jgi:hypothetical protein
MLALGYVPALASFHFPTTILSLFAYTSGCADDVSEFSTRFECIFPGRLPREEPMYLHVHGQQGPSDELGQSEEAI